MLEEIKSIFKQGVKPKRFYSLSFKKLKTCKQIFEKLLFIYKCGAIFLFGKNETINILELSNDRLLILQEYMHSFGINPIIRIYTPQQLDNIFLVLIDTIKNKFSKSTKIKTKKRNGKINELFIEVDNLENLKNFIKTSDIRREFLDTLDINLFNQNLIDFKYSININGTVYVLRFDYIL